MKNFSELYYQWNNKGLYKNYKDYYLDGLIEVAGRDLQVDLRFMAMKSTAATLA
jgi:hypothetical protein